MDQFKKLFNQDVDQDSPLTKGEAIILLSKAQDALDTIDESLCNVITDDELTAIRALIKQVHFEVSRAQGGYCTVISGNTIYSPVVHVGDQDGLYLTPSLRKTRIKLSDSIPHDESYFVLRSDKFELEHDNTITLSNGYRIEHGQQFRPYWVMEDEN